MRGLPNRWRREGLILQVPPLHPWWASHAQLPTVLPLSDRLWRIYFAARDGRNRSHVLAVDVDPCDRMRVLAEHFEPLLAPGRAGAFDHTGVLPSCALAVEGQVRLYYSGLFVREDVRGSGAVGLALSDDGLSFRRAFEGPVHGVGPYDPFFGVSPMVCVQGQEWRMYYVGGGGWRQVEGVLDPFYEIRQTTSTDGLVWSPRSRAVFPDRAQGASSQARPWITGADGDARLWFSQRGEGYRQAGADAYHIASIGLDPQGCALGTAEPALFDPAPASGDFDGWMQAYGCVAACGEDLIMVYNGDDFGRSGFGWARLEGGAAVR